MTEKRLYDVINKAEPRGQSVTYEGIPCTARTCATRLNRLTEENEKLKQNCKNYEWYKQYKAVLNENEQLKQQLSSWVIYMTEKYLKLSDIFDIEIVLKDGKYWYELEFDDYILDGFSDFPIKAVLKKGKRINKKQVMKSR